MTGSTMRAIASLLAGVVALVIGWQNPVMRALTRDLMLGPVPAGIRADAPGTKVALVRVPSADQRRVCARLIERLAALGAQTTVLAGALPPGPDAAADDALAAAVRAAGQVVAGVPVKLDPRGANRIEYAPLFPRLQAGIQAHGALTFIPDPDGTVRVAPLELRLGGKTPVTHVALRAARRLTGAEPGYPELAAIPGAALWARFAAVPEVAAKALLEGDTARPLVAGRAVFLDLAPEAERVTIGTDATGAVVKETPAWLAAAWTQELLAGGFARDAGEGRLLLPSLALVALSLALWWVPAWLAALGALAASAGICVVARGQFAHGLIINAAGVSLALFILVLVRVAGGLSFLLPRAARTP